MWISWIWIYFFFIIIISVILGERFTISICNYNLQAVLYKFAIKTMTDGCLPRQSRTACKQPIRGVTELPEGFLQCTVVCNLCTGTWTEECSSNISVTGRLVMSEGNGDKSHWWQDSLPPVDKRPRDQHERQFGVLTLVKGTLKILAFFFIQSSQMRYAKDLENISRSLECFWTVWDNTDRGRTHSTKKKSPKAQNQTYNLVAVRHRR